MIDINKCKQLIDEFYKEHESSGGVSFPSIKTFKAWLKGKTYDDQANCTQLLEEFEKSEKPFHKNPNIKLDELCLATFMDWVRKTIATNKKSDWVGKSLNS